MSLNIKDPEAHRLARAIARETGETMTRAVIEALRERHQRLQQNRGRATAEEILAIGQACAALLTETPLEHGELLYDEAGLPK